MERRGGRQGPPPAHIGQVDVVEVKVVVLVILVELLVFLPPNDKAVIILIREGSEGAWGFSLVGGREVEGQKSVKYETTISGA